MIMDRTEGPPPHRQHSTSTSAGACAGAVRLDVNAPEPSAWFALSGSLSANDEHLAGGVADIRGAGDPGHEPFGEKEVAAGDLDDQGTDSPSSASPSDHDAQVAAVEESQGCCGCGQSASTPHTADTT
jgi:hypothetical protein